MAKKKRRTTDAVEIITRRYFAGRKDLLAPPSVPAPTSSLPPHNRSRGRKR